MANKFGSGMSTRKKVLICLAFPVAGLIWWGIGLLVT